MDRVFGGLRCFTAAVLLFGGSGLVLRSVVVTGRFVIGLGLLFAAGFSAGIVLVVAG